DWDWRLLTGSFNNMVAHSRSIAGHQAVVWSAPAGHWKQFSPSESQKGTFYFLLPQVPDDRHIPTLGSTKTVAF
ncbi:MAG: hypothetical protein WCK86_04520, partial [Planctomycetia bacterium]